MSTASNGAGRRGFITGGSWCVDRNKLIEFWPQEDGVAEILSEEARGGGSGCNLAIDIKKLDPDFPVETIGLIGDDDDGRLLFAEADSYGIDRRQLAVTREAKTFYTDAYGSRTTGRRTHIYNMGAGALLTPDHFDFAASRARILHLGLPGVHRTMDAPWQGDPNGWVTVLRKARAAGLLTNIELVTIPPARLLALVRPCLPHLDLAIVNDSEIGALGEEETARDGVTDIAACIRAARKAMTLGSAEWVVVHFPTGALALSRDGTVETQASVRVPPAAVAGANGAGDAFAAGFLYGYHESWGIGDCLALGHACAAASLRAISTTASVETWQACLDLATEWGWNDPIS